MMRLALTGYFEKQGCSKYITIEHLHLVGIPYIQTTKNKQQNNNPA